MLNQVLTKAGSKEKIISSPFDLASEFGLTVPGESETSGITMKHTGDKIEFTKDGEIVAEAEFADAIPSTFQDSYKKVVIYDTNIHPYIRQQILQQGRLIKKLNYKYRAANGPRSVEMLLQSNSTNKGKIDVPAGSLQGCSSDSPLTSIYKHVSNGQAQSMQSPEKACETATNYLSQKDAPDAFLSLIEYSLSSGSQGTPETQKLMKQTFDDPTVKTISQNLEPQDQKSAQAALSALKGLNTDQYSKGYIVDIFKGNIAASLGQDGTKLLIGALGKNPSLTGAYNDLGGMYYSQFDTQTAWDAWDLGRKINPNHPMWQRVNQLEQHLQEGYPEFFLSKN